LDIIAASAKAADENGTLSEDGLAIVRQSGLLELVIPESFGGGGGSALCAATALRRLAAADGALALALNMHLFSVAMMVEHWRLHRDFSWLLLEAVASQQRLVASAFAEPGLNGDVGRSRCTAKRRPDGFAVTGIKTPCSLVQRCDLVCLQFETSSEDGGRELHIALIPSGIDGTSVTPSWDSIAMRATESHSLVLRDCLVPKRLVFYSGPAGAADTPLFKRSLTWFCLGVAAVYSGIASAALAEVRRDAGDALAVGSGRYASEATEVAIGGELAQLLGLDAMIRDLARLLDGEDAADAAMVTALAVKDAAAQACRGIVGKCMALIGAKSLSGQHVMSRLFRDAQAAIFHPPGTLASQRIAGRALLGRSFELGLSSS